MDRRKRKAPELTGWEVPEHLTEWGAPAVEWDVPEWNEPEPFSTWDEEQPE